MPTPQTARVPYSKLRYNRAAARYIDAKGKFLDPVAIRGVIDDDIKATKERMRAAALKGQGDGDLAALRESMRKQIAGNALANIAAAKGGFHRMTPADFGRAGQFVRAQLVYLNARIDAAVNDAKYAASPAFVDHLESYGNAGRPLYEAQRLVEEKDAGFGWEFNELNDASHHCKAGHGKESCQQQTDKGVVEVGTLVRFGGCACGGFCECHRRRYKSKEAAEAAFAAIS